MRRSTTCLSRLLDPAPQRRRRARGAARDRHGQPHARPRARLARALLDAHRLPAATPVTPALPRMRRRDAAPPLHGDAAAAPDGRRSTGERGDPARARVHGPAQGGGRPVIYDTSLTTLTGPAALGEGPVRPDRSWLTVSLVSFAFRHGLPREADLVFDARFLRNPHYDDDASPQDGPRSRGAGLYPRRSRSGAGPRAHRGAAAVPAAALSGRGQELPHDRRRLHRRQASLGVRDGRAGAGGCRPAGLGMRRPSIATCRAP